MENSYETSNGNGVTDTVGRHSPYQTSISVSLSWLHLRVFYFRVSKCEIDDTTPEYLSINFIPLHPDTLLEVNGVRTCIDSDGASAVLRRDRLDKKSEEATFVSTDSVRVTGDVKFEVSDMDVVVLSGIIESCSSEGESRSQSQRWIMNCDTNVTAGASFLKSKQFAGPDSAPTIEVYVAGSFLDNPIILNKSLQLSSRKKQRKGRLNAIPEYEPTERHHDVPSMLPLELSEYSNHKAESENYSYFHPGMDYLEGEDGELSWFNAGVRVGVGIGLGVCVGVGIGVGLLVRTYQSTTRNFRRRLL